jgi:hypothetical protein
MQDRPGHEGLDRARWAELTTVVVVALVTASVLLVALVLITALKGCHPQPVAVIVPRRREA